MHHANVHHDVWDPDAMAAGQQDPSFEILHAGLEGHLAMCSLACRTDRGNIV